MTTEKSSTYKQFVIDNATVLDGVDRLPKNEVCVFCGGSVPSTVPSHLSMFDDVCTSKEWQCSGHRRSFMNYCAYLDNAYQFHVGLNLDEIVKGFHVIYFKYAFWDCGCLPMDEVCCKVFPHFTVSDVLKCSKLNLLGAARLGDVDWGDLPVRFLKDSYGDHGNTYTGTWEEAKMPSIWPVLDVRSFLGYIALSREYLFIAKDFCPRVYNRDEIDENELFKIRIMILYANHRTYISGYWRSNDFITLSTVEVTEHSVSILQNNYIWNEPEKGFPPLPYNPLNWPLTIQDIVPTYPQEEPCKESSWSSDLFAYGEHAEFSEYFPLNMFENPAEY